MIISGQYPVTWGVPVLGSGFVVQTYDISYEAKTMATLPNEQGVESLKLWNDFYTGITVNTILTYGTPPLPGSVFNYSGLNWLVDSSTQKGTNKGFPTCDIKAFRSQGIGPFN